MAANSGEVGGVVWLIGGTNTGGIDEEEEEDVNVSVGVCMSVANSVSHMQKIDIYTKIAAPKEDNPLTFITLSPKSTQITTTIWHIDEKN
jgi:hypothetical protein